MTMSDIICAAFAAQGQKMPFRVFFQYTVKYITFSVANRFGGAV